MPAEKKRPRVSASEARNSAASPVWGKRGGLRCRCASDVGSCGPQTRIINRSEFNLKLFSFRPGPWACTDAYELRPPCKHGRQRHRVVPSASETWFPWLFAIYLCHPTPSYCLPCGQTVRRREYLAPCETGGHAVEDSWQHMSDGGDALLKKQVVYSQHRWRGKMPQRRG